jgi:hypothetical protein
MRGSRVLFDCVMSGQVIVILESGFRGILRNEVDR